VLFSGVRHSILFARLINLTIRPLMSGTILHCFPPYHTLAWRWSDGLHPTDNFIPKDKTVRRGTRTGNEYNMHGYPGVHWFSADQLHTPLSGVDPGSYTATTSRSISLSLTQVTSCSILFFLVAVVEDGLAAADASAAAAAGQPPRLPHLGRVNRVRRLDVVGADRLSSADLLFHIRVFDEDLHPRAGDAAPSRSVVVGKVRPSSICLPSLQRRCSTPMYGHPPAVAGEDQSLLIRRAEFLPCPESSASPFQSCPKTRRPT